jgi:catechol 2,3-dioxygenase-like lactoylglutathione lyase family enzyme
MLTGLAPVLLVTDVVRAAEYYRDKLGFEVSFYERIPEHYAYAERDGCRIHFARFEGVSPRPNAEVVPPDMFDVYFWVDDVEQFYADVRERGAEVVHGPVDQGYSQREFRVRDPDGYILAFGQPLYG